MKAEGEDEDENDLENTIEDFDIEEDQAMGIPDEEEEDSDDEGDDEGTSHYFRTKARTKVRVFILGRRRGRRYESLF